MASAAPFSVLPTGNAYIDALLWGDRWDQSTGPITYDLWDGGSFGAWSGGEAAAARTALRAWSEVAALRLVEQSDRITDLNLILTDLGAGILGRARGPQGGILDGLIELNPASHPDWPGQLGPGGYSFITLVHEIGHALGLAHPHDDGGGSGLFPGVGYNLPGDTGTYGLNTQRFSIMSYNDIGQPGAPGQPAAFGFSMGPMAFDIAAVQWIYGANMATRAGADSYVLPGANREGTGYRCIWDAGGADRIVYAGPLDAVIDLRAAPLVGPQAGGYLSRVDGLLGGFTIANGVLIESALSGSGDDLLIGNAAANLLQGGAGADQMRGGAGNDVYMVDDPLDSIVETATGGAADLVRSSTGYTLPTHVERLLLSSGGTGVGNPAANLMIGSASADTLHGGGGNDVLDGGMGPDQLHGGTGVDLVTYARASGPVIARLAGTNGGAAAGDELIAIEHLQGSALADFLQGSAAANSLIGGDGHDRIYGEAGNDRLDGQAGDDRLLGGNDHDRIFGGDGVDLLVGGSGNDILLGGAAADSLYGGDGGDFIYGGDGPDRLHGGEGLGRLYGGNDADLLQGGNDTDIIAAGEGADLIIGKSGADRIDGGAGDDRVYGDAGDDFITGGAGDDLIFGGDGRDIALFAGRSADYGIVRSPAGLVTVTDLAPGLAGDDGADRLIAIEWLRFSDRTLPNLNRAPTAPADRNLAANAIGEDARGAVAAGITAFATDPDGDLVRYSIAADPGGLFAIDAGTGVITLRPTAVPDFEGAALHIVRVAATDLHGARSETAFVISVLDRNEGPAAVGDADPSTNLVAAGSPTGTAIGITALATDPENDAIVYSLADNAGGRFAIDAGTGLVTVDNAALLAGDAAGTLGLRVRATEAGGLWAEQDFALLVTVTDTAAELMA